MSLRLMLAAAFVLFALYSYVDLVSIFKAARNVATSSGRLDERCELTLLHLNENWSIYELDGKPIIWQYWHQDEIPLYAELLIESLQCKNPQFRVVVIHDSTLYCFLPDLVDTVPPDVFARLLPAHKADLFRAQILYKYGGIYVDVDSFATGHFWPWYRKLEEYDMVGVNWRTGGLDTPVSTGIMGPTRANVLFFELIARKQLEIMQSAREKLLSSKSYPLKWGALANHYLPIMKDLLAKKSIRYLEFDGVSTVGQLVVRGFSTEVIKTPFRTVMERVNYNLTWAPILYWHLSGAQRDGILKNDSSWDYLMDWTHKPTGPSMFAAFVSCGLVECVKDYEAGMRSNDQFEYLSDFSISSLSQKLETVKPDVCAFIPKA